MGSSPADIAGDQFAVSPAVLSWARIWKAVKRAAFGIISSEAGLRCAGVAFYGFLSFFPAIAAAVILFGLFLDHSVVDDILTNVSPLIPEGPEEILRSQLVSLENQRDSSLGLGLVLTLAFALWSGTRGTDAMVYAVTRAYHEENERDFIKGVLVSVGLTLLVFLIAAFAIFSIAIIPLVLALFPFPPMVEAYATWLRWPVITALVLLSMLMFYRIAPYRRAAKIRWIMPGALFASLLWLAASYGFSFYVENFGTFGATFGSLSAVVVLLLWFYYSSMIFVFGAMINAELELETLRDTTKGVSRPIGQRGAYVADHISDDL